MITPLELLDETVEYYKTHKRGVVYIEGSNIESACVYKNNEGNMCAVGRCIDWEKYDDVKRGSVREHHILQLKKEYKHIPLDAWVELQSLHDVESNWSINNTGGADLSQEGVKRYNELKKEFKNYE